MDMTQDSSSPSSSLSTAGLEARTFDQDDSQDLYSFIGTAAAKGILIHVVGSTTDPRILVVNASQRARRNHDWVCWSGGANCGAWRVMFDKEKDSPLDPPGPYESTGTPGGFAVGDLGKYPYTVVAEDSRTGNTVTLDPDLVIVM